jgi:hypothetical protein
MILAPDSRDEVPADDAAAHLAGHHEAEASEHLAFRHIPHARELQSQSSGEHLVEGHRSLA